jgi:hypothetical protein
MNVECKTQVPLLQYDKHIGGGGVITHFCCLVVFYKMSLKYPVWVSSFLHSITLHNPAFVCEIPLSAVGITTHNALDNRGVWVRVPVGSRIFTSPYHPYRLWDPPSLLRNWYRNETTGAWRWPATSSADVKKRRYIHPLARGSVVVKAPCCKQEGHGFETRWFYVFNLPNPSGRTRPWDSLIL